MPAGRPTKYTPDVVGKILLALEAGAPFVHACNYAGVSFDTFNECRKKYTEFSEQLKEAEGKAVVHWLEKIESAAKDGNWQAAAWKLERRYPHDFGRRDRMPVDVSELDRQFEAEVANLVAGREADISSQTETDSVN